MKNISKFCFLFFSATLFGQDFYGKVEYQTIQNKSKKKEFKRYGHYTNKYGYRNNPLEIDSRDFAKKNTMSCIKYLESRKIISVK